MDYIVHVITKSWTRLSDFQFHLYKIGFKTSLPRAHVILLPSSLITSFNFYHLI